MSSTQSGTRTARDAEASTSTGMPASKPRRSEGERRLFRSGDKVSNRYRILRFIARGGMGEVYAALDAELGQPVALKAVRPEVALHSQTLRRFRREINLSRKVTHQNVCRIYDVGTHYDEEQDLSIRYLTMELLEGLTLTRYLRKHGTISPDEALPIVVQIASGLGAAHDAGVVHRDFKTSNVLLLETSRGLRAVITDFGLSQTLKEDGLTPMDTDRLTGTGQLMGTLAYLAPEQLEGKPSSAATDIYSLGVVLYQMLTGHLPFDGGSPLMAALKRLHEEPPHPRKFKPELDDTWCDVMLRCLERDASNRYRNTEELLEALGFEALTDSSTAILRPIMDRRRGLGSGSYQVFPPEDPDELAGTEAQPVALPKGALPMWKAVALAIVAGLFVLGATHLMPRLLAPPSVQVLVAEPLVFGEDADFIASSFEAAVLRSLASLERVHPLDSSKVEGVEGPPEVLLRTAGADELVQLEVRDIGREWGVTLKRFGEDGEVLLPENFRIVQDDSRLQADAIQAGVRRLYPDRDLIDGTGDLAISSDDYAEFLKLRYAIERDPRGLTRAEILRRLTALREKTPEFTEILLYEARAAAYLYRMSREEEYLAHAHAMFDEARSQAPDDPRPLEQLINLALVEPDIELAEEALRELRAVAPGEVVTRMAEANVAEARGERDHAVELMSDACGVRRSPRCLADLARILRRAGRAQEAITTLETVVSEWPNYWWGTKLLAGYELVYGDLDRAEVLYLRVLDRNDPDLLVATNLSIIYMIDKRYGQAVEIARLIGSRYPKNTTLLLNLAEAEELAGNESRARELYTELLELLDDQEHRDRYYWGQRAQAEAHLGMGAEARASVARLLEIENLDGLAHFEAAVVFATLGDLGQGREQADLAEQADVPEHFFRLPWLDPLDR